MNVRGTLPAYYLSPKSKDEVKLGTGLIGTMLALAYPLPSKWLP